MTRYVIDGPTLVQLVESGHTVDPSHQLVAPNALRSEALELLLDRVRAGELSEKDALALHEGITRTKVRLLGDRVSRATAWRIARQRDWPTLRDAEVLAVTKLQADALVTVDPALAAKADGVVPLASYDVLLVP